MKLRQLWSKRFFNCSRPPGASSVMTVDSATCMERISQNGVRLPKTLTKHETGNLAPMPGVFPDYPAPVIRNTDRGREMAMMRWGMPPPPRTPGPDRIRSRAF